jgi:hypothetical protein
MILTPTFTFTVRLNEEGWEGMEMECAGETAAIDAGREALQARIDLRPVLGERARHGAVGVGIGSMIADRDRVVWLGEWEWSEADGWYWQSSD